SALHAPLCPLGMDRADPLYHRYTRYDTAVLCEQDRPKLCDGLWQTPAAIDNDVVILWHLCHLSLGVEQTERALLCRILAALVEPLHQLVQRLRREKHEDRALSPHADGLGALRIDGEDYVMAGSKLLAYHGRWHSIPVAVDLGMLQQLPVREHLL